jgi:hypothetical protein
VIPGAGWRGLDPLQNTGNPDAARGGRDATRRCPSTITSARLT